MWVSAEQLVNSVTKGKLFAIKLLHLHECFSSPLDSTRRSSTAYPLHKLTHTHLQMGHSTCLLPESFRKLLLASPLQFPVGFSKRNENLTSVCLNCREWCLPYVGERRKTHWCARAWKNKNPFSLQCHTICQLTETDTFLSAGFQRQEHF